LVTYKRDPRLDTTNKKPLDSLNIHLKFLNEFLKTNNINRVELDNIKEGYKFKSNDWLKYSIYLPYVYISTSRKCLLSLIEKDTPLNPLKIAACNYECQKYILKADMDCAADKILFKGNAQYYYNDKLSSPLPSSIDRVVYQK